jgi:hypothetical protein
MKEAERRQKEAEANRNAQEANFSGLMPQG